MSNKTIQSMKKVRVDFSAHMSVVVAVKDGDDYLDRAAEIAKVAVNEQCFRQGTIWEVDDGGVDDANNSDEVDITEE